MLSKSKQEGPHPQPAKPVPPPLHIAKETDFDTTVDRQQYAQDLESAFDKLRRLRAERQAAEGQASHSANAPDPPQSTDAIVGDDDEGIIDPISLRKLDLGTDSFGDLTSRLNHLVLSAHTLLQAESVGFFIRDPEDPRYLKLEAYYTQTGQANPGRIFITSKPKKGLLAHCAAKQVAINILVKDHPLYKEYGTGLKPMHLKDGYGVSLLCIPIIDRKGKLLGVFKADNKLRDGQVAKNEKFSQYDIHIASVITNRIILAIEYAKEEKIKQNLMQALKQETDIDKILDNIIDGGLDLLNTDRAELALWDEQKNEFTIKITRGDDRDHIKPGIVTDRPSILRTAYENNTFDCWNDLEEEGPAFKQANPDVNSAIVTPVRVNNTVVGALTFKSTEYRYFSDDRDRANLDSLAYYVSYALLSVGREDELNALIRNMNEATEDFKERLESLLQEVRNTTGIDSGLIFISNPKKSELQCKAAKLQITPEGDPYGFTYRFSDPSLATSVYNSKNTGLRNLQPGPDGLNPDGAEFFQIEGPALGIPIIYRQSQAVGVMVLWSHNPDATQPEMDLEHSIEPFIHLAALDITLKNFSDKINRLVLAPKSKPNPLVKAPM